MAILVDEDTRLVVQGLTGREGRFHALRNRAYGTQVVAGVRAGKGGQEVEGVPVFDTVAQAVVATGANTSLVFVPAASAVDALYEAVDAGIGTVVMITENVPVLDMTRAYGYVRARGATLVGPNGPGVISPGKANVGIIPGEITHAGPVGLVSRSGTLTYQVMYEMAAAVVAERMTKPVVAYIAGFEAPPGKRMGHAGAIISGSSGTAQAKAKALQAAGVRVGRNPTEAAELAVASVAG